MLSAEMTATPDNLLLDRYVRRRDAQAFAELTRRHAALVFATARRITGNAHDALDVSQECFLELVRRAANIDAPLPAWLHRVACTRALNAARNLSTRKRYEAQLAPELSPPNETSWSDVEPFVDESIAQLPPELRIPLIMHYLQGQSQSEVATILGLNQSTVSRRLQSAIETLRQDLRRRGVALSAVGLVAGVSACSSEAAPPALTAALGKMAVAGPTPAVAAPAAAAGAVALLGKLLAAAAVAVALAAAALILFRSGGSSSTGSTAVPTTAPSSPTSKTIDNIPTLGWGRQQETTYIGCLAAALQAVGPADHDYVTLMGDSALAFRLRWWRASDGPGWDPSSPVGEMPPWIDLANKSVGLVMNWELHLDGKTDMRTFKHNIVTSIDAGLPVFGYFNNMDMALVYGYASGGDVLLLRDYYAGDAESRVPLASNKGLLGFITERKDPPARRDAIINGLQQAVKDWNGWEQRQDRASGPGVYYHGRRAYDVWIEDLKTVGALPDETRKRMFQPSWWTFNTLVDARNASTQYLRRSAQEFEGDSRAALERAADAYEHSAKIGSAAMQGREAFLGPWSGKGFEQWDDEARGREVEVLTQLRESDGQAVAEIEKALPR